MKMLVVDDSPGIVELLSAILTLSGHVVDEAYDGYEAVKRLQETSYDVVITDAQMPGMGGEEVCKLLKAEFPAVYIIGISGNPYDLGKLRDAGADICLAKPFRVRDVQEAVENRELSSGVNHEAAHSQT